MDFTAANTSLTPELLNNTSAFTNWVNGTLLAHNAIYGIGGYSEHRTIYQRSHLFDALNTSEEPRRLHLGIDIWGRPNTPVYAPLDGIIHSFGFHSQAGDYGAVIIMTHRINDMHFYTLYGHLSLNSIRNLKEGIQIRKGEVLGEFGLPFENGQWPPHLHFQIITDMQERKGDFPGVCKFSEREKWLSICPDPELLLRMKRYIVN